MMLIDSHCHFEQLTSVEQQSAMQQFIVIGVASNLASAQTLLKLAKHYPNLKVCLGIHPEYPQNYSEFTLLKQLIYQQKSQIVGIGEIGLPYFTLRALNHAEKQMTIKKGLALFTQFIRLASELNLPVNLHCVANTAPIAINILNQYQIKYALFHWFEGQVTTVTQIIDNGWFISVSPDVLFNPNYQKFIHHVPLDIICLESDGPWPYQGKRGNPAMILDTAYFLAKLHDKTLTEILAISQQNSYRLWQLNQSKK
ncbi:TatD family hydrolase [Candidatus Schmidhempelia bombi]|uniref:TatD family deoxyribonuclease n=1 Tax=Candidatus Schmidhempelia bombi str. Bimp TaxID=1387197 RepID=A0AB94IE38_9GAMM|nr:TatD family hydrolase [Candidatus Schmidhempelia bombi]TEA27730.1 TatD family deoxyribonuclease [Candidatus Schmidhempelia bombi str. Bimp]